MMTGNGPMAKTKDPQQVAATAAIKAQRDVEAARAMREYRAEEAAVRASTARLRALRLARDAEIGALVNQAKSSKKVAKPTR